MSEPIVERLSRFTPDAGGLDRDGLLFAAGRDSARPNRGWKAVASLLAGTQALSLVLLWPRPTTTTLEVPAAVVAVPEPLPSLESHTSRGPANPEIWSVRHGRQAPEIETRPRRDVTFIASEPPLRASGPVPPSLLN